MKIHRVELLAVASQLGLPVNRESPSESLENGEHLEKASGLTPRPFACCYH